MNRAQTQAPAEQERLPPTDADLQGAIVDLMHMARSQERQSLNACMLQTYWRIGQQLVQFEHRGARADGLSGLLAGLAARLTPLLGSHFSAQSLLECRAFYRAYPTLPAIRRKLSWHHYRLLLQIQNLQVRAWLAYIAAEQGWSVQTLESRIIALGHERPQNTLQPLRQAPLTSLGYTGARTAAAASGWVRLVDSGGQSTLQIDAHSGSGGAASGFVDLVRLNGVTGKTLADLVSGGFVHLGGLQLSNVPIDQVVSETASLAGIRLAAGATLAAEGGQWAAGFGGGQLVVSLDHATASDTLGLANTDGVSYDAASRAVRIGGTQVATVDPTLNGVGAVGQLAMVFDFSSAGASYSTEAQQATAVQTVLRAVQLSSSTPAPLAIDRGITFRLTDALGDTQEVMSGLDITPEANRVTVGGVTFVTGTESVETLVGTSADETLVGYNGVPTAANTANLGTALTFGDTLTGGGGKDTFQWLQLQVMNSDASDRITDFGLKGGTGTGQGVAEADVIDLAAMLEGFNNGSTVSDFVRAANVGGKVQIQVDYNGKANGSAFENTWFMTLDNLTVNANNQVVANNATVAATAQGLTGNLTIDTLVQQMVADSQFKLL